MFDLSDRGNRDGHFYINVGGKRVSWFTLLSGILGKIYDVPAGHVLVERGGDGGVRARTTIPLPEVSLKRSTAALLGMRIVTPAGAQSILTDGTGTCLRAYA